MDGDRFLSVDLWPRAPEDLERLRKTMSNGYKLRVGLVGLGLDTYWAQFEGLFERLQSYLVRVAETSAGPKREIVNLGMVDSHAAAIEAGHRCRRDDIDLLLLYPTTYALSATVLPIVLRAKVPLLVLSLQPELALDYEKIESLPDRTAMTGEWLAFCSACPVPEILNVLQRLSIPFEQVTGALRGDGLSWQTLD